MGPVDHRYLGLRGSDGHGKDWHGHCAAVPAGKLCEKSLPISIINVYDIRVPRVSVPPAGRDPPQKLWNGSDHARWESKCRPDCRERDEVDFEHGPVAQGELGEPPFFLLFCN